MADVEQMKKIVQFVTCEIAMGQSVGELMFGVDVHYLNFGFQIKSVKQPKSRATLWVLDTCLVGLRPLMINLITASLSSKTYNIAMEPEGFTFDET